MADPERIKRALDSLVYLPSLKKRAFDDDSWLNRDENHFNGGPASVEGRAAGISCRPWDRSDLFRRVHTFKASTWFCKPDAVGPINAARHGWINTGIDLLTCEFCRAKLSFPVPPNLPREDLKKATEAFRDKLNSGHDSTCPWRDNACQPALAHFPPLPPEEVASQFRSRCGVVERLERLPPLAAATLRHITGRSREQLEALLRNGPAPPPPPSELRVPSLEELEPGPSGNEAAGSGPPGNEEGRSPDRRIGPATNGAGAAEALESLIREPAGNAAAGTDAFLIRQRLLALTGWRVRLAGSGEALRPVPAIGGAEPVPGEKAILYCPICGATAGLWLYLPHLPSASSRAAGQPSRQPRQAPQTPAPAIVRRPSSAGTTTIAGGALVAAPASVAPRPFGTPGLAVFGAPSPPVFGTPTALASQASTPRPPATAGTPQHRPEHPQHPHQPRHGRQPSLHEVLTSQTIAGGAISPQPTAGQGGPLGAAKGGPFGTAGQAAAPAFGRSAGARIPAFGIEAAKSPVQRSPALSSAAATPQRPSPAAAGTTATPQLGSAAVAAGQAKRPREESGATPPAKRAATATAASATPAAAPALGGSPASSAAPFATQNTGGAGGVVAGAAAGAVAGASAGAAEGGAVGVAMAAAAESSSGAAAAVDGARVEELGGLDPIGLHRHFCPWVASGAGSSGSSSNSRCGWRWCLDALAPGGGATAADAEDTQQQPEAGWDPAANIRSILRRVDAGRGAL